MLAKQGFPASHTYTCRGRYAHAFTGGKTPTEA